jgi:hypothetical protein
VSVVPAVSPGPSAMASEIAGIDLLRVRAHALPPAATCPVGSDPDRPGAVEQDRPEQTIAARMAFDLQSGRIVTVAFGVESSVSSTWTFDVCANAWARRGPGPGPTGGWAPSSLVYDADSDRTIALALAEQADPLERRVAAWSYDVEDGRWTEGATSPALTQQAPFFAATYHDPSGLVVVYDGTGAWAYDVDADTWSAVRWKFDWLRPAGAEALTLSYDPVRDHLISSFAVAADDSTRSYFTIAVEPGSGLVDGQGSGLAEGPSYCSWANWPCSAVFADTIGRTIWIDGRSRVQAWDPASRTWEMLFTPGSATWCENAGSAGDLLHGRIVCRGRQGGVAAFTPATRTWQWLLAPGGTASPSPSAGVDGGSNILATTQAHALPPAATCPAGSDPNRPGPVDQERPPAVSTLGTDRSMAFDRAAGVIVLLATTGLQGGLLPGSRTWTFDVCTNTWHRMSPAAAPPLGRAWLSYDADSDRIVAVVEGSTSAGPTQTWVYDLAADRWARAADPPPFPGPAAMLKTGPVAFGLLYHDVSGLVVLHAGTQLFAYDVESDTWSEVRQRPDPTQPAASGLPPGVSVIGYDSGSDTFVAAASRGGADEVAVPETWTFSAATGTWRREAPTGTPAIPCGWSFAPECGAVFDPRSGLTVFFAMTGSHIQGYDAAKRAWLSLEDWISASPGPSLYAGCDNDTPAFDAVNERIVCRAGLSGVAALQLPGRRTWLLAPQPGSVPSSTQ